MTKSLFLHLSLAAALLLATATASYAQDGVRVNGFTRSNGTYVQPYVRSAPDSTTSNNWSTKGNTNPYTGQEGTRNPTPSYHTPSTSSPYGGVSGSPYGGANPYGGGGRRGY